MAVSFCRVQGVIEKEIGFELWMPMDESWNGRYLGAGVGGDAGVFNYGESNGSQAIYSVNDGCCVHFDGFTSGSSHNEDFSFGF